MSQTSTTLEDIVTYFTLSLGTLFSLFTVLLILSNHKQMTSNLYARLMFLIQLFLFLAYTDDFLMFPEVACQATGSLFYFFFMMSNLVTLMMMLLVYEDLENKRQRYRRLQPYLAALTVGLSAVVGFVPINSFQACYVGTNFIFCGYCFEDLTNISYEFVLIMIFYCLPGAIGFLLTIFLCKIKIKLQQRLDNYQQLSTNQKQALNIIFIPFISVVLIIINLISHIVYYSYKKYNLNESIIDVTVVLLNSAIFLLPLVNFVFFVRFVGRLEDVVQMKVRRCRWVFGLKAREDGEMEEELSDL